MKVVKYVFVLIAIITLLQGLFSVAIAETVFTGSLEFKAVNNDVSNVSFEGYYLEENGSGEKYISGDGYLSSSADNTYFTDEGGVLHANYSAGLVTLPTLVKENYRLLGWSETQNDTEATYLPGATISVTSDLVLYPVWKVDYATYVDGESFNSMLKTLAKGSTVSSIQMDSLIKLIKWQSGDSFTLDDVPNYDVNVSCDGAPIYAWFEEDTLANDGTGIIKLWSEASKISFNNDCKWMFAYLTKLNSLDPMKDLNVSSTKNITNMYAMFNRCTELTYLNLSSFDTSNVTNMRETFRNCKSITQIDISSFDTHNVEKMDYMFSECQNVQQIILDKEIFNTSKVTNMGNMFYYCQKLTSLEVNFDNFDTRNVTDMKYMFGSCSSLTTLDLSTPNFDTSNVENMDSMFYNCSKLTSLDLTHNNFNTSKVKSMIEMFRGMSKLSQLDLTHANFNTSNVTDMRGMFYGCTELTELDLTHSNFNTAKVTKMGSMFSRCTNLTSLDLSHFDTNKLQNIGGMFSECIKLTRLDLSAWDTSSLTTIAGSNVVFPASDRIDKKTGVFEGCGKLTEIDLTGWNTSQVTEFQNMFYKCNSLEKVFVSSTFDTSNATKHSQMFYDCTNIYGGNGTTFSGDHIDKEYAHIDGYGGLPGYFWCHDTYNITYNANESGDAVTNMPSGDTKEYGDKTFTLSAKEPVRSGYKFIGWSTLQDATDAEYAAGALYEGLSDLNLYAVWKDRS